MFHITNYTIKVFLVLVVSLALEQLNQAKMFVPDVGGGNNPKKENVVYITDLKRNN